MGFLCSLNSLQGGVLILDVSPVGNDAITALKRAQAGCSDVGWRREQNIGRGGRWWWYHIALCVPGLRGAAFSSLLQKCPKPGMPPWTPAWHPKSVEVGGSAPLQSFSKHDPRNSSNSISRQLVRNAESGPHLTPTASKSLEVGPRNLHFTSILLGCL